MKLSFLIPAYNAEKYIDSCLSSILRCTEYDIEVIVVVQQSDDKTYDVCKQKSEKDERLFVYKQDRLGVSAARNEAILHAKGEYFVFVDADDWINTEAISIIFSSLQEERLDFLIFDAMYYDAPKYSRIEYDIDDIDINDKESFLTRIFTQTNLNAVWGKVFSRDIIMTNHLCFDTSLVFAEDLSFEMDFFILNVKGKYVKSVLYYYRKNCNSATNRFCFEYIENMFRVCAKKIKVSQMMGFSREALKSINDYCGFQIHQEFIDYCEMMNSK